MASGLKGLPYRDFVLSAKVALLTRGNITRVISYPIPADLDSPPLERLVCSQVPQAVTGWSRVLGLERASST